MAGKALAALAFLTALAGAQEHAYRPDAAWLAHATEKWLVWLPDDEGASLDPPAEAEEEQEIEINGVKVKLPKLKKFVALASRTVYVIQSAADQKHLRKVVMEWKDPLEKPLGLCPVTVCDDGTLMLAGLNRDEIVLCWPDGTTSRLPCFARDKPAVLVAAYPDGVVLQTPRPDELKPGGERRPKRAALYWVAWGESGLESEKAQQMSFHEGILTAHEVHVARFGDDVAMPGGIYSLRRKRRQRFSSELAVSIYAFDGRVALGSTFAFSVRQDDRCGMVGDHEYFLAHDGIGYWLEKEKGSGTLWRIRACRLRDRAKVLSLGHVRFWTKHLSTQHAVEGTTLTARDSTTKTRFTIYWTKDGLRWTGDDGWESRAWLRDADFK